MSQAVQERPAAYRLWGLSACVMQAAPAWFALRADRAVANDRPAVSLTSGLHLPATDSTRHRTAKHTSPEWLWTGSTYPRAYIALLLALGRVGAFRAVASIGVRVPVTAAGAGPRP